MMAVTAPNEEFVAALLAACMLIVVRRGEDLTWPARSWLPVTMAMGGVAGVLLLTKFSAGLLSFGILILISLALLPCWSLFVSMWTSFIATATLLWLLMEGDLTYFGMWAQRSSVIASSYSGAMATYDVTALLGAGFAGLGVIVALFAIHRARALGFPAWTCVLVLLTETLGFYIGWKLAFVRIEPLRISAALVMLTPLVVWAIPRTWPPIRTGLAAVAFPLAALGFAVISVLALSTYTPLTSVVSWASALKWSISEAALSADLDDRRAELDGRLDLSPEVQGILAGKGVHVDPVRTATVWAYLLTWRPMPIIQNFPAHDNELDQANLDTLLASSPDQVVLQGTQAYAIDDRNILWDPPRYQLALLCNFDEIARDDRWSVLQRGADRCSEPIPSGSQDVVAGVPVAIPKAQEGQIVLARFTPERGVLDALVSLLLKPPSPLTATVNGITYRVPWGFDGAPLLVSCPAQPTTPAGLYRVCPSPPAVEFNHDGQVEFETVEYQSG